MKPIEAVCFGLDDTLFDYLRYAKTGLDAAGDYLEALTGQRHHAELYDIYFEEEFTDDTFERLLDRHGLSSGLREELIEAYHSAIEPLVPYPETESVLSRLTEEYRLAVVTDGRKGNTKLRRLGLRGYFEAVIVTPAIEHSKRDAEAFERALSELSVQPRAAVHVGADPRVDFRAPNELGMATVRLRRGRYADLEATEQEAAADHEIADLEELLGLLVRPESLHRRLPRT